MATSNMVTVTSSLVRSLQNCSLNHHQNSSNTCNGKEKVARGADLLENPSSEADTITLELNSKIALPSNYESYLNLKTGEIYYVNGRTGLKFKDDPQSKAAYAGCYNLKDDVMSHDSDSEGSSTKSSPAEQWSGSTNNQENNCFDGQKGDANNIDISNCEALVTVGCRGCYMYLMVPKHHKFCFKCGWELIHFDSSKNGNY